MFRATTSRPCGERSMGPAVGYGAGVRRGQGGRWSLTKNKNCRGMTRTPCLGFHTRACPWAKRHGSDVQHADENGQPKKKKNKCVEVSERNDTAQLKVAPKKALLPAVPFCVLFHANSDLKTQASERRGRERTRQLHARQKQQHASGQETWCGSAGEILYEQLAIDSPGRCTTESSSLCRGISRPDRSRGPFAVFVMRARWVVRAILCA